MTEWLFWALLSAMLAIGRAARVGALLGTFAAAAGAVAVLAAFLPVGLDEQLQLFLGLGALPLATLRAQRRRNRSSRPQPSPILRADA